MTKSSNIYAVPQKLSPRFTADLGRLVFMERAARREIGARIAQCRRDYGGMTQQELADLLGLSERSVQDYERGVTVPYKHFDRLAQIFPGRSAEWFRLGDEGIKANDPAVIEEALRPVREQQERVLSELQDIRQILESEIRRLADT